MDQPAGSDSQTNIDTGGGAVVQGNASAGKDFIGRDQLNIGQVIVIGPGERVRQGLGVLPALMDNPAVRDASAAFRAILDGREPAA